MEEREVLRGRIRDFWNRTRQGDYLNHTGFLSLDLQSYARQVIREEKIPTAAGSGPYCAFSGGYEEADRQMLFFVPSYMSGEELADEIAGGEGALTCVRIAAVRSGFTEPPTHRDYLGSLMNIGITREQIGDIICREDEAFVFAVRETAPFICSEVTRVRHTTVTAQIILRESGLPGGTGLPSVQIPGAAADRAGEGIRGRTHHHIRLLHTFRRREDLCAGIREIQVSGS